MAETACCTTFRRTAPARHTLSSGARRWLMLGIWIAAIVLFMGVVGPALLEHPALRPMAEVIEARGIEANMYFYTEVEAFYDANVYMDNTWAYTRRAPAAPAAPDRRDD
jgi:hypothetical protein